MPWQKIDGGYRKKGGGGFVRNPRQYERLRELGMSKERAAAITNSDNVSKSAFGVDHGIEKAFDSERQRHRRQEAYEGATAGGAALTGGVAARTGRAARQTRKEANRLAAEARATHIDVQRTLHRMAQPTGSAGNLANTKPNVSAAAHLHRQAVDQNREALGVAHHARQLGRRGKLTAITSASLAATSYGLHRHDRKGGSSYSYR
jgi:hypothetical protein